MNPSLEWKGGNFINRGHIIYCLKACKMILKGCLYHIVNVKDLDSKTTPIDLVHIVREFLEVFPNNPHESLLNGKLILVLNCYRTNPILITPYRMAPAKLK